MAWNWQQLHQLLNWLFPERTELFGLQTRFWWKSTKANFTTALLELFEQMTKDEMAIYCTHQCCQYWALAANGKKNNEEVKRTTIIFSLTGNLHQLLLYIVHTISPYVHKLLRSTTALDSVFCSVFFFCYNELIFATHKLKEIKKRRFDTQKLSIKYVFGSFIVNKLFSTI